MPWSEYTGSESDLADSAEEYFRKLFENPQILKSTQIDSHLSWIPSLHFKGIRHDIIAIEASETPYPAILRTCYSELLEVQIPIVVYCICHEDVFLKKTNQSEFNLLEKHGFGLLTVSDNSEVKKRISCIPLIQHIPDEEFENEIRPLTKKIKIRIKDSFETYKRDAGAGLANLTEVAESIILDVGNKLSRNGDIPRGISKRGNLHALTDSMYASNACINCKPAIGGIMSYISTYRNTAHHTPKNRKQAHRKYKECKHGFIDGIKQINRFRDAFKNGLRISVGIVNF